MKNEDTIAYILKKNVDAPTRIELYLSVAMSQNTFMTTKWLIFCLETHNTNTSTSHVMIRMGISHDLWKPLIRYAATTYCLT